MSKAYREARQKEMRQLAEILGGTGIIRNVGELNTAASKISEGGTPYEWTLDIKDLVFSLNKKAIDAQRHRKPSDVAEIDVQLNVRLHGRCLASGAGHDPFVRLSVECVASARRAGDVKAKYHSAWHLERQSPGAAADLAHPAYHLQYGGMRLAPRGDAGNHLLLDSPRVAHPPLDGVLAVDFVISNYFPKRWRELRSTDRRYKDLIEAAQERYWRPYAAASSTRWSTQQCDWDGAEVWPQVVRRG